ncbi:MAG: MBG domain-containing protein [Akkermansiaceae bacterium]|nr:MBG domain-containing protein [Akkermansiaceae bacterium]
MSPTNLKCPRTFVWTTAVAGLGVALALSDAMAIEVTLENLVQTYIGGPITPSVSVTPSGLSAELTYRSLSHPAPASSEVVFSNNPEPLRLSYSSVSFCSNHLCGLGNYLQFAGSARQLEGCDVTLVTWAKAADYPVLAAADATGYTHPVTLTLYQVSDAHQLIYLTELNQPVLVPWRPLTLPNGDPYPVNGYAFRVSFDLAQDDITLPAKVLALVSYNTQASGFEPIGVPGPYNQLNVAVASAAPVTGADADPGEVLRIAHDAAIPEGVWWFPSTALGNPMPLFQVRALATRTTTAPVEAGDYEVSATISDSTFAGGPQGTLTIGKAVAELQLTELTPFYTGSPLPAGYLTNPPNLPVDLSYNLSSNPPTEIGDYQVAGAIADPNYTGEATGVLSIRPSYNSWMAERVAAGTIPPERDGDTDDPDLDGIPNLMEYAFNLDPASASNSRTDTPPPLPRLRFVMNDAFITYRRNLDAADVSYEIRHTGDLSQPAPWPAVTGTEEIISDDGHTRVIETTLPLAPDENRKFYRLHISR